MPVTWPALLCEVHAVLARILHEHFCSNRGFAATISLSAGVLAAQSLDVLFSVRLGPSWLCLPVSPGDSTISRRSVMKNAADRDVASAAICHETQRRTPRARGEALSRHTIAKTKFVLSNLT